MKDIHEWPATITLASLLKIEEINGFSVSFLILSHKNTFDPAVLAAEDAHGYARAI